MDAVALAVHRRPRMTRSDLEARTARFGVAVSTCSMNRFRERASAWLWTAAGPRGPLTQLLDSSTAIGANYRASSRARSRREFVAKIGVVAEEADEAVYWLELLQHTRRGDPATVASLLREAIELRAIFAASYKTARRRRER